MRFLVDECTGPAVAQWLRDLGHDVFSVYEEARGKPDDAILQQAVDEDWILITIDKDFGEKVHRDRRPHKGVVFLRLDDQRSSNKIAKLQHLLAHFAGDLPGNFVVVTETKVRIARKVV